MRTKTELYRDALHRIQSRRQRAVTLAEEKKAAAMAAVPQLESAQDEVRTLGLKAMQLAASGASADRVEAMQDRRREAQAQLNALMAAAGYGPDSLQPKYTCSVCRDTGYANGALCRCVGQMAREIRRAEIAEESPLSLSTFDSMRIDYYPNRVEPSLTVNIRRYMAETLGQLKEYAADFDMKSVNLLITGNAGLGKTHASLAIAKQVLDKGYDVVYLCSQRLFGQLERDRFADSCPLRDAVLEADLFILDDLGTEHVNPYMLSCFYDILNTRMLERRPTIYTSNIVDGQKFEARYTEKISSRLAGSCEPVLFLGDDIRALMQTR